MKLVDYLCETVGIDSLTGTEVPRFAHWAVNLMMWSVIVIVPLMIIRIFI